MRRYLQKGKKNQQEPKELNEDRDGVEREGLERVQALNQTPG